VEECGFVTGEYVEIGALLSPEHLGPLAQNAILPSLHMLAKWEQEGKIRSGVRQANGPGRSSWRHLLMKKSAR
jgi:hypothetical protein